MLKSKPPEGFFRNNYALSVAKPIADAVYESMEFAKKLEKTRAMRGMSQAELGAAAGLHQSRISKWEQSQGQPSMRQVARLAKALRISLDYLADDSLDNPPEDAILTDLEKYLLEKARAIGVKKAIDRVLLQIPLTDAFPGHGGEPSNDAGPAERDAGPRRKSH